jgi:hypothetical protein
MTEVHQRSKRRKGGDPSPVESGGVEPLDLADPEEVRRWLDKLDGDVRDIVAAGDDATRPLGQRDLGRRTAREQILESGRSLHLLVEALRRSLPASPDAGDPV